MSVTAPGSWRGLNVRTRYTRKYVEVMLPLAICGIEPDRPAPVPDYRSGGDDRPSDMPAVLADMQEAWKQARMEMPVRRAAFLYLVRELTDYQIAAREGVDERTSRARRGAAVFAILDYLNGGNSA